MFQLRWFQLGRHSEMPASRSSALTGAEGLTGRVSTFSIPAEHILGSTTGLPQRPLAPRGGIRRLRSSALVTGTVERQLWQV